MLPVPRQADHPLAKEISIVGKSGEPEEWKREKEYPKQESYALCRCGKSKNKPFCDGSHAKAGFEGTETASRKEYLKQAQKITGSELDLTDVPELCASQIQSSCNCPSGRLVVWDKDTNQPIEPKLEKSIGLIEDPQAGVSGPIWLKGGIQLVCSDGTNYEQRNRITLCRCGKSKNKPFCDGSHIDAGFNDGDENLK